MVKNIYQSGNKCVEQATGCKVYDQSKAQYIDLDAFLPITRNANPGRVPDCGHDG